MAKISVRYTVVVYEDIDWPDDELEDLTYDNLLINLDIEKKHRAYDRRNNINTKRR